MGSHVGQVLDTLRGVVRDIREDGSRPASPAVAPAATSGGSLPSAAQLLLQISALHKGFLALSEAFLESLEGAARQAEGWEGRLETARREMAGRLQVVQVLEAQLSQLAAQEEERQSEAGTLRRHCQRLEARIECLEAAAAAATLEAAQREERAQQEGGGWGASSAAELANEVARAVNARFEEHLQDLQQGRLAALVEQAVERQAAARVATALPAAAAAALQGSAAAAVAEGALGGALSSLGEAVEAAAGLAAQAATQAAAAAGEAERLAAWSQHVDAAHGNHEARLARMEDPTGRLQLGAGTAPAAGDAAAEAASVRQQLAALQLRQARLEAGLAELQQDAQHAQQDAQHAKRAQQHAQEERTGAWGGHAGAAEAAAAAAEGLDVVQERLAAVAAQQAQQAQTTEELVQSVLADVMALARHTKALYVRGLRTAVDQTQDGLLQVSAAYGKALGMPPPVGPFTSFLPQL